MDKIRAIVTGGSSGIGRETALLLAESGCDLILPGRNIDRLRLVTEECRSLGVIADPVIADLTKQDACDSAVNAFLSIGQATHPILINCAGLAQFGEFHDMATEDVTSQLTINLTAAVQLTHAFLPVMLKASRGQVVNVLSIAATHPFGGAAAYCASKAGLHMFGKALAAEYRGRGIRVTSLILGSTDTPLWDNQSFQPDRADMLSPRAVAECIRDVVLSPVDRSFDEITLMPPKGIL